MYFDIITLLKFWMMQIVLYVPKISSSSYAENLFVTD